MKRLSVFFSIIVLIFALVGCSNKKILGNDTESILDYLEESKLANSAEKKDIKVFDDIYIGNSKIVGFRSDTSQGVLIFEKDKNGDYILHDGQSNVINENSIGVTDYIVSYNNYKGLEKSEKALVLLSDGLKVSNVEISINNNSAYKQNLKLGEPSMVFLDKNKVGNLSGDLNISFKYFDKNKKEIHSNI